MSSFISECWGHGWFWFSPSCLFVLYKISIICLYCFGNQGGGEPMLFLKKAESWRSSWPCTLWPLHIRKNKLWFWPRALWTYEYQPSKGLFWDNSGQMLSVRASDDTQTFCPCTRSVLPSTYWRVWSMMTEQGPCAWHCAQRHMCSLKGFVSPKGMVHGREADRQTNIASTVGNRCPARGRHTALWGKPRSQHPICPISLGYSGKERT